MEVPMRVDAPNPMLSSDADRRGQGNRERPEKPSIAPFLDDAKIATQTLQAMVPFANVMPLLDADSLLLLHQEEGYTPSGFYANRYVNGLVGEEDAGERVRESA
jgi:hypothetical protein